MMLHHLSHNNTKLLHDRSHNNTKLLHDRSHNNMKLLHDRSHNNTKLLHDRSHNNMKLHRNRRANLRRNRSSKNNGKTGPFVATRLYAFLVLLREERLQRWRVASAGISIRSLGND
jgi:hypothetical protein